MEIQIPNSGRHKMKTDYCYPAKNKAHQVLKRVADKWIEDKRNATVACFPGPQAIEILRVYDLLGFQRKNIVGIEREDESYTKLEGQNLGIELYHGEARDFFLQPREFNVISLDYTQLPSIETIGIVRHLFKERKFANNSLLYTNFYASHINDFTKYNMPYVFSHKFFKRKYIQGFKEKCSGTYTHTFFWAEAEKNLNISLKHFRSNGLSHLLLSCLKKDNAILDIILKRGEPIPLEELKEVIKGDFIDSVDYKLPVIESQGLGNEGKWYCNQHALRELIEGNFLFNIITGFKIQSEYAIPLIERFEYVSNDNSLMYSDILCLDRGDEHFKAVRNSLRGINKENALIPFGNNELEYMRNKRIIEKNADEWAKKRSPQHFYLMKLPERKDITPPLINKEEVIKMLKEEKSVEYIATNFRGFKKSQLVAFKANLTRGNYDLQPNIQTTKSMVAIRVPDKAKTENNTRTIDILNKGVIFFDSNNNRLSKNMARTVSSFPLIGTSLLNGNPIIKGLKDYVRERNGLYVLNSFDEKVNEALDLILSRSIDSRLYFNLLFIGAYSNFIEDELESARSLNAKIRETVFPTNSHFIDPQKQLCLESIVL